MRFKYVTAFAVFDPDINDLVTIDVWEDCVTGKMFGDFLDQVGKNYNPFTGEKQELPEPDSC